MSSRNSHLQDLIDLFASIESKKEAEMLLMDILTPGEREEIAERWQLIQALASGLTQREVAKKCKVSISKVTRGAKELKYGAGGFRHFLRKLSQP